MPLLERDEPAPGPIVQGFAPGGFSIDGQVYAAALLSPERAQAWEAPATPAELELDYLAPLLALDPAPEFVILGTGPRLVPPPRALRQALEARGIGIEIMDSRTAARTWGLLRGEERWIAAALMPI